MDMLKTAVSVALIFAATSAQAGESLWCQLQAGHLNGPAKVAKPPKVKGFVWGAAHDASQYIGPVNTSIGTVDRADGPDGTNEILLNGKPVALPPAITGLIKFGKVYDFGGTVAMAYLVERKDDPTATPSDVVLVIGKDGTVSQSDVLPGTQSPPADHCYLN